MRNRFFLHFSWPWAEGPCFPSPVNPKPLIGMAPDDVLQGIIVALGVFFQVLLVVPGFYEGNLGSDFGREAVTALITHNEDGYNRGAGFQGNEG